MTMRDWLAVSFADAFFGPHAARVVLEKIRKVEPMPVKAETVTTYVVQVMRQPDDWSDTLTAAPFDDLTAARSFLRDYESVPSTRLELRIIERRVTTVEEVMP